MAPGKISLKAPSKALAWLVSTAQTQDFLESICKPKRCVSWRVCLNASICGSVSSAFQAQLSAYAEGKMEGHFALIKLVQASAMDIMINTLNGSPSAKPHVAWCGPKCSLEICQYRDMCSMDLCICWTSSAAASSQPEAKMRCFA